jgi:predicted solute-binding protein
MSDKKDDKAGLPIPFATAETQKDLDDQENRDMDSAMERSIPQLKKAAKVRAELNFYFYQNLLKVGFSKEQALELVKVQGY